MKPSQWFHSKALLSFVMSASILLAGCASTGSTYTDSSVPAADPRLTQGNDAQFFSKSGYQACAVAAGVGILGCALSNTNNKAQCAIVAGIAACGVAMGANYYLDQRRSEYADTTQRLQVMSQEVQQDTQKVAARTETLQQVIRDDQERLAQIKRDMDSKSLDKTKAQQDIATIDENIVLMRKDLTNMKAKVGEYQKVADQERSQGAGKDIASLDQEISKMNQKVAALQSEVDGLYSQRSAITLG